MQRYELFIDGESCPPTSGQWFDSDNPYTGRPWAQVAQGNAADVDIAVKAAHGAFSSGPWPELTKRPRGAAAPSW